MSVFRQIVVYGMILWLAFQAGAVVAMPFCAHDHHGRSDLHQSLDGGDKHDEGCHAGDQQQKDTDRSSHLSTHCDDCGSCQLACSAALPARGLTLEFRSRFSSPEYHASALSSFSPELHHPPPVRTQS